ncbi:hypothetical protein [Sinisalibacter aestuarii]|uniref:Uncharacterized protein n=1 Tax=Sinisalibacter aestuarii TaxID=2949426 RepID=A0ABQ5LSM0_9RHOB|nr:hypothetical protein [Sinisalibacter aestuarii]GKY87991.1 hypothetical protein STA1M1_18600 [Sinisalibacter aestuarii]
MPLDKLVLILVVVIAAAAATVWIGMIVAAMIEVPLGWMVAIPAALVAYIVWRVIAERIGNDEDDHYDGIDR